MQKQYVRIQRLGPGNMQMLQIHQLIILRKSAKIWNGISTLERRLVGKLWHKAICQGLLIAPLRCRFRLPRPVEPAVSLLERRHLGLRIRLEKLLVVVGIRRRVTVRTITAAGHALVVRRWAVWG